MLKNFKIRTIIYKENINNVENIILDDNIRIDNINENDLEKYFNDVLYQLLPSEYQKNIKIKEIYYKKSYETTLYKVADYIVKNETKNNIYKKLRSSDYDILCIQIE